jgi:hypothetical protein
MVHDSLYDLYVLSEDKTKLLCQINIIQFDNSYEYTLFPLPLEIKAKIDDVLLEEFDETFNTEGANIDFAVAMQFCFKLEKVVIEVLKKYPHWHLPNYLVSYCNVDFEIFDDWVYYSLNKDYIKQIIKPNYFYLSDSILKTDIDALFLVNLVRYGNKKEFKKHLKIKKIKEKTILPLITDDFAPKYFENNYLEDLELYSISLKGKEIDPENLINKNLFVIALDELKELKLFFINIINNDEAELIKEIIADFAQSFGRLIDRRY